MSLMQSQLMFLNSSQIEDHAIHEDVNGILHKDNMHINEKEVFVDFTLSIFELGEQIELLLDLSTFLKSRSKVAENNNELLKSLFHSLSKVKTDFLFLLKNKNIDFSLNVLNVTISHSDYSTKNLQSILPELKLQIFDARVVASKLLVVSNVTEDILKLFSLLRHLDDSRALVDVFALCNLEG